MKKQNRRSKKRKTQKPINHVSGEKQAVASKEQHPEKKVIKQGPVRNIQKKPSERKGVEGSSILGYISKGTQFLRESKIELKKVKWPTRKELLASTAVVIILVLIVAFFLGLVDFGLLKIIKNVIG